MKRETEENNISVKRIGYMSSILFLFMAGFFLLVHQTEMLLDEVLCLVVIHIVAVLLFLLIVMKNRVDGTLRACRTTSYRYLFCVLAICWCCLLLFRFCPDFFAPFMFLGVLLTTVLNEELSIGLSLYFVIVFCMTGGLSQYVCYCYSILLVLSILLSSYLWQRTMGEAIYIYFIYFLLNMIVPIVFYYISYLEITGKIFLYGIFSSLCSCGAIMVCYVPFMKKTKEEVQLRYLYLLDDDYDLIKDMKRFSMAEYHHGKRVSKLAGICTTLIGGDESCAMCAGFYYRLGKMEGEPEIDNALKVANNHCFPKEVMNIMEEYGGIVRLPQTPESAIVHMVDALVTKIELLDKDTMSSTWNQDMVIYQTLNELSQKGLYDESGLSINQFLKIREKLVQEESLL